MNRREFIGGVAGAGCCAAAGGCRAMLDTQGLCGRGRDYFCTWETQRATRKVGQSERDNLDEYTLFSEGGWARELFPRDMLADAGTEITGHCRFTGEDVVLPGELLAKIGASSADDGSSPGTLVYME